MQRMVYKSFIFNKQTSLLLLSTVAVNHWYRQQQPKTRQTSYQISVKSCLRLRSLSAMRTMRFAQLANENENQWIDNVYNKCIKSVVKITRNNLIDDDLIYWSTGWIVDSTIGLIVTNYHNVEDCPFVNVWLPYASRVQDLLADLPPNDPNLRHSISMLWAHVLYVEPHLDLALLTLPKIKSGQLAQLRIAKTDATFGDQVMAIGFPDLDRSVITGIIKYVYYIDEVTEGWYKYRAVTWPTNQLYMFAPITASEGCSGGAVVNMDGQVVGVLFSGGFKLLTITRRQDLLDRSKRKGHEIRQKLVNDRKQLYSSGKPFIGVFVKYSTDNQTCCVHKYMPNAENVRQNFKIGDQIITIDKKSINNFDDLMNAINQLSIGQSIELRIKKLNTQEVTAIHINRQTIENSCFF
ncbi:uncharacterized protein LOC128955579 [Oppia nitens]|uniref:uncharacterized protein LOC128955579 n=1 Tax=Oppia nitens TaxID=1686743 RepID=UPI0023D994DB|nr:uncharacterized protein LOC128955579 [Oppia nitens]